MVCRYFNIFVEKVATSEPCYIAQPPHSHVYMHFCMHVTMIFFVAFWPFGFGNGDREGPREVDGSDPIQDLQYPIIFFQREYTDLYVSQ